MPINYADKMLNLATGEIGDPSAAPPVLGSLVDPFYEPPTPQQWGRAIKETFKGYGRHYKRLFAEVLPKMMYQPGYAEQHPVEALELAGLAVVGGAPGAPVPAVGAASVGVIKNPFLKRIQKMATRASSEEDFIFRQLGTDLPSRQFFEDIVRGLGPEGMALPKQAMKTIRRPQYRSRRGLMYKSQRIQDVTGGFPEPFQSEMMRFGAGTRTAASDLIEALKGPYMFHQTRRPRTILKEGFKDITAGADPSDILSVTAGTTDPVPGIYLKSTPAMMHKKMIGPEQLIVDISGIKNYRMFPTKEHFLKWASEQGVDMSVERGGLALGGSFNVSTLRQRISDLLESKNIDAVGFINDPGPYAVNPLTVAARPGAITPIAQFPDVRLRRLYRAAMAPEEQLKEIRPFKVRPGQRRIEEMFRREQKRADLGTAEMAERKASVKKSIAKKAEAGDPMALLTELLDEAGLIDLDKLIK